MFELFKEEARKSAVNLASIESKIATIEKWLHDNKLEDTTLLPLSEITISTEKEEKEVAELTIEIKNISEKNKKISQNNTYKDMLGGIDLQKAQSCTVTEKQSYDKLQSELGNLRGRSGVKKTFSKTRKLGDHCPTCEQEVDPCLSSL